MQLLWQGLGNGLMLGGTYVLVAAGMVLAFSIVRIMNFAHGELYMLGAYATYFLTVSFGLNLWVSVLVSAIVLGIVGMALQRFVFVHLWGNIDKGLVVTIGLILILQTAATVIFGTSAKRVPNYLHGSLVLGDIRLAWDRVLVVVTGIVLMGILFLLIRRTKAGQAMVAIAQDPTAATLQGINARSIAVLVMAIAAAFAAVAGSLMGSVFLVEPTMGTFALTKGMAVMVLGGLGSLGGAVVGGVVIGLIDGLVPVYSNTIVANIVVMLLIVAVLLIKPQRGLDR